MPILAVSDITASLAFYQEGLGFSVTMSMPTEDGGVSFAIINMGEVNIGISAQPAPDPKGNGVVFMLYPPSDYDIDAHYDEAISKGIQISQELKTEYWGDKLFGVADPDGYQLQFCKTVQQMSPEEIINQSKNA